MGFFDSVIKTITSPVRGIAKSAAPLSPVLKLLGPQGAAIGSVLDVVNSIGEQQAARDSAQRLASMQESAYSNNPYLMALQQELLNPSAFQYRNALERASHAASGAADQYTMALGGRGFGADSSALRAGLGRIYSSVPEAAGQAYGDYLSRRPGFLMQGADLSLGSAGGLGGLRGYYASKENDGASALAGSIPVIGQDLSRAGESVMDWIRRQSGIGGRPKNAGDNSLGTNQAGNPLGKLDVPYGNQSQGLWSSNLININTAPKKTVPRVGMEYGGVKAGTPFGWGARLGGRY